MATRMLSSVWRFTVLKCVVNQVPGNRSKADAIIRHNMPWLAADHQKPELDRYVKLFLNLKLDHMLASCERFIRQNDHIYVARVWGMLITICAKFCRPRVNDMLKVIQQCFNVTEAPTLIAALMQWRCLIYAFFMSGRLLNTKCIDLILTPVTSILSRADATAEVRLACIRCWATLIYALGEEIGSYLYVVTKVVDLASKDPSIEVRETVARVLASLLNQFCLPEDKMPKFAIPQMIIGTTVRAAGEGKNLSETHGPFSSE
ncbi:hypothetical protein GGI12_006168, partial [Dipsacomyces acuminosporus]